MTRNFQIITAILLSLATLLGSAGLSLHKMACLDSGRIAFSLEKDFCCVSDKESSEFPVIDAVCCDFDQLDFTVSDFDFSKSANSLAAIPTSSEKPCFAAVSVRTEQPLYEKLIPPLETAERLSLFCSFLI